MHSVMWGGVGLLIGVWALWCARKDIAHQRSSGVVFAEHHSTQHEVSWVASAVVATMCATIAHNVFHNTVYVVMCCVLIGTGLRMSWIDVDTHTIPRRVMRQSVGVAVPIVMFVVGISPQATLLNIVTSAGVMWLVLRLIEFVSRGQLGHADVVCAAYIGLFVGAVNVQAVWVAIFSAFFTAGVVAVILVVFRISSRHSHIPLGPFLFFGAMYAVLR